MTYCTLKEIISVIPKAELINLTVDEPDYDSVIDEDVFTACAITADSLINGYVRARYELPLKSIPQFLKAIATDITAYRLYMRRPQTMPEHIKDNYDTAIKQLLALKKGDILLETPQENDEMPDKKTAFRTNKTAQDKIFHEGRMRYYRGSF
jgi:phage gp36-like protein